jgi:hypothetical protein
MKKTLVVLLGTVLLMSLVTGCTPKNETAAITTAATAVPTAAAVETTAPSAAQATTAVSFSLKINGKDFSQEDFISLQLVTVIASKVSKDGTKADNTWTGYQVDAFLKTVGVADYQNVTVIAADGFSAEITAEAARKATTLFGMNRIDQASDAADIPILVVDGEGSKVWVKGIVEITTN